MDKQIVGWREWLSLPDIGISAIKAKVDTGARTSALHAFEVKPFDEDGVQMVKVRLHPLQNNVELVHEFVARVHDQRWVSDSGGHRELRYVIKTDIRLGDACWPAELTLTNRDSMKFRMLLGRTAMEERLVVDPEASFLVGQGPEKTG